MWNTFQELLDSLVSNIDDFFVIILIAVIGNKLANLLYIFLRKFMKISLFACQTVKISLQVFLFATCIIQLLGADTLSSATGGIAIGVGYAFQPYIISIFNGLMVHNDDIINSSKWISIAGTGISCARVESIGLFNTMLKNSSGDYVLISNSMLSRSAVTVMDKPKNSLEVTGANDIAVTEPESLHYLQERMHHS